MHCQKKRLRSLNQATPSEITVLRILAFAHEHFDHNIISVTNNLLLENKDIHIALAIIFCRNAHDYLLYVN